jgi:hypothetical protein
MIVNSERGLWQVGKAENIDDPRSGIVRRHHLDPRGLQRAVRAAVRLAELGKPVSPHTLKIQFFKVTETWIQDTSNPDRLITLSPDP